MASAEPIDVEVRDKVADGIRTKLLNIATASLEAFSTVNRLQAALNLLNASGLAKAVGQSAIAQQNLARATTNAATAATRGQVATVALATAQNRLAGSAAQAATAQTNSAAAALRLANAQARAKTATDGHNESLVSFLRQVSAAIGVGFGVKSLIELGDAYTTLQNKLQNVSTSQAQVTELTQRLFDIANRTRQPVEETATAFTRFDRSLKSLGKSQEDSLQLTETVNKALIVSGANGQEAASALLQLSQAFNSGKLQGDEFRSVSENLPIVLDAIAKSTKTPINQIKNLAKEGKITSEVLFNAFKLLGPQVAETFAKTVPTVAQAFVVLKNKSLEAFGEFNKATGFTETLAKGIIFLSNNLGILTTATVALGLALVAAFAPSVIAGVGKLSAAFVAFTSANPWLLLAGAIVIVGTAIATLGDKVEAFSGTGITLLDTVKALLSYVQDGASAVYDFFKTGFIAGFELVRDALGDSKTDFAGFFDDVLGFGKFLVNQLINVFVGLFKGIKIIFNNAPEYFEYIFKSIANLAIDGAETIINSYQGALRLLTGLLGTIAPELATKLNGALDDAKIVLPRVQMSKDAQDVGEQVGDAFVKGFKTTDEDFLGQFGTNLKKRAAAVRDARLANVPSTGNLRGTGANTNVADPDKNAIKRATFLAKITAELNKQIESYGLLDAEKATYQKLEEIDIQLASKKLPLLSASEKAYIARDLAIIESQKRVNAEVNRLYEELQGPIDNYNAKIEASQVLYLRGKISLEQYGDAQRKAANEFREFLSPMTRFNDELDDQQRLLGFVGDELEVQNRLLQAQNELKKQGKSADFIQSNAGTDSAFAQRLRDQQDALRVQQAANQIYQQTTGAQKQLEAQLTATQQAFANNAISADLYAQKIVDIQVATANLNLSNGIGTFEDAVTASLGRIREGFTNVTDGMSKAFGDFFSSFSEGFANSIGDAIVQGKSLKDTLGDVARTALSQLISALVKVGLQYVINAALGEAALATTTAAQVGAASAVAAAWAPAAALTSLASFGANAVPASAALVETTALASILGQLKGFEAGGFTGTGGRSDIAGVVHGQEFVANAAATRRNRGVLEAMNAGATVGSGRANVVIEDHTSGGVAFESVPGLTADEVRMIARDEASTAAPKAVANQLAQPNSDVSKSLRNTHNVTRKRS